MKLVKFRKKKEEMSQEEAKKAEALFPKIKTFSRAYEYSPSINNASSGQRENTPPFRPDERPYPVGPAVSASSPVPFHADRANPERIDLQDTILTDESFVERYDKLRTVAPPVHASHAVDPAPESEHAAEAGQV